MGNGVFVCRQSSAHQVTMNMIAWLSLLNLHYFVEKMGVLLNQTVYQNAEGNMKLGEKKGNKSSLKW